MCSPIHRLVQQRRQSKDILNYNIIHELKLATQNKCDCMIWYHTMYSNFYHTLGSKIFVIEANRAKMSKMAEGDKYLDYLDESLENHLFCPLPFFRDLWTERHN